MISGGKRKKGWIITWNEKKEILNLLTWLAKKKKCLQVKGGKVAFMQILLNKKA